MAFGMCIQSTPGTTPPGALAALADELHARGLMPALLAELGLERMRSLTLQITVDRTRARRARTRTSSAPRSSE